MGEIVTYQGNPNVKADGVEHSFTKEQLQEYMKCMHSPEYFAQRYLKVIHLDKGLVPFDLYPYQERMFQHFNKNRFSIVLACRQSGKSISSCAYLLWYALFHPEQTIAILANKGSTSKEMLARITLMLENIPFFLQPGCKALNKQNIDFSNNSRIISASTSSSSIRGFSINLLYLDEFAFVKDATTFYTSTYPVVSSGKTSRVIITSTANGVGNMFHKLWEGAQQGTNEYKPFRVDWFDVPGRDEEWKRQTIANTSELQFEQEYGNSFLGTGNTLFNPEVLLQLKAHDPIENRNMVNIYEHPEENHNYICLVDVAQGRNLDYSTFNIIDITKEPFKQVATYRCNTISPLLFPDVIYKYAKKYNNAYVIIESNDQGAVVCNALYYDLEYENLYVESGTKADALGVRMNKKIKRMGCSNIKDLVDGGKIEIVDCDTIIEMSQFQAKGNSYQAVDDNHDDLVMNLVLFGWFASTELFKELSKTEIRTLLYEEQLARAEQDLTPVGILDESMQAPDHLYDETFGVGWHTVKY